MIFPVFGHLHILTWGKCSISAWKWWVLSLAAWCGLAWMMWQKLRVTLWKKAKTSSVSIHVGTALLRLCSQTEKVKKSNLWEAYLCLYLRKIHTHIKCICVYAYIWMNKYTCICFLFVHILWKCIPDFQDIILLNLRYFAYLPSYAAKERGGLI